MVAKKAKKHNFYFEIFLGGVLVFVVVGIGAYVQYQKLIKYYEKRIFPNVYLDTVNFGGKTPSDIEKYFSLKNQELLPLKIEVVYEQTPIATFSAQKLKINYAVKEMQSKAFSIGHTKNNLSQIVSSVLHLQDFRFPTTINYDQSLIQDFVDTTQQKYSYPAKNALFKFQSGKVIEFRKEVKGLKINSEAFLKEFDNLIFSLKVNPTSRKINLTSTVIKPEITLDKANDFGIVEEIATGKSNYSHSIAERVHNVILAASKFDGILIPKNKVFSFNDTVGDISSTTGYKPAYIIKAGKTVLGDGGGVCQVSTTLFRAALNAGLPIVERYAHAYRVGYYENDSKPGFDATVFSPTADLKIENNTSAYILIQTEIDKNNNLLYFHLYGKKDNRKITISPVTVYDVEPALPDVHQDDPTLPKGTIKQVDFAATGAKATFNYEVMLNGNILTQRKFFSNYRPWAAVYLVGTKE